MRTRIIQDQTEPETDRGGDPGRATKLTFAARIARWSASHRKLAIWGWLALVLVLVGVVMNAKLIETQRLTAAEQVAGEAGDAEKALDASGLNPTEEIVLIESQELTVDDRRSRP